MILVNLKMIAFEALQAVEKNKNNFFISTFARYSNIR